MEGNGIPSAVKALFIFIKGGFGGLRVTYVSFGDIRSCDAPFVEFYFMLYNLSNEHGMGS